MEPDLIDTYVRALHRRLRWRPDVDDLVDEAADHLREHVERLVANGTDPAAAQQETLARFGDVRVVARAFADPGTGAPAVPTRATRTAGTAALAASALWTASAVVGATGGHTDLFVPWTLERYLVWVGLLMTALALTTLAAAGVLARTGRLRTPAGIGVLVVGAALTVGVAVVGWGVTVITAVLGAAVLVALRRLDVDGARAARPLRLLAVWIPGSTALVVLDEFVPVGPSDVYGDHQVAWLLPFLACALCSAAALARVGVRLRSETAVDLDEAPPSPLTTAAA